MNNMELEQSQSTEFATFLKVAPASDGDAAAPLAVIKDLVVSRRKLGLVYAFGSIVGYFVTLVLCAQCSIGLSPLAWKMAGLFQAMPARWCAVICGSIFGIAPFIASVVLLSRFQHRYLLFRMTWVPILVPVLASGIMTVVGSTHTMAWHGLWILAAIATPYLLESIAAAALRQGTWSPIPR